MSEPVIVIAGAPDWADSAAARLPGYRVLRITDRTGYVARLTDALTALILVDAADPNWQFWIATPKSSPATRRIPIIAAGEDAGSRAAARVAGANLALSSADLLATLPRLMAETARIQDPAAVDQLDCECAEPLPPLAVQGVAKFNAGEYYKQHDLFEEQWMHTEGPVRDLYRAILQVGIAYFQIERGNYRGALKMLLRSVQWFALLPDTCQGVDVRRLKEDSERVRAELERLGEDHFAEFDHNLIRPVQMAEE